MINAQYQSVVYSFFMALLMSSIMSLTITIFNLGIVEGLLSIWLKAWSFSFVIAFPTVILVSPFVKRMVKLVIKEET
ncbi:DUF2798 domain-containing protein [Pseudoalteromonas denitrificans]|uniref:DUF2798 domain-containing protein n=1 Tax=Pseudoalteromonas denitrificans DSM 6059 TaxID=1123010 RepID=A0A1I1SVJ7_9GAMM|nr:DUF2798 domain-containing protein [Pseudoalteromonas denitrificans]SFD50371.1 Protein of unknown function [Pseudoalteromonas denitrificans DSM 6059]